MATTADTPGYFADRQGRIVTQIITRPFTTITAIVTLGDGPTSTLTTISTPTSSATLAPSPSTTLSPGQLGALLGSVLGFALLALLVCCGLTFRRRQHRERTATIYVDDDMSTDSEDTRVVRETLHSTRAWNRQRGGRAVPSSWTTVPPPVRFPPTPRHAPYRQTGYPQMPGVVRYP